MSDWLVQDRGAGWRPPDARDWPETGAAARKSRWIDATNDRVRATVRSLRSSLAVPILCAVIAAPLLFGRLGHVPFDDPGEGMHAEIARELADRRAPLRLSLNGVLYADKPPLLYGLVAGAFGLAGRSERAARTVSRSWPGLIFSLIRPYPCLR